MWSCPGNLKLKPKAATSIREAFTLVELLVVLGVVGILAGIAFPAVQGIRETARQTQCQSNLRQISIAAGVYAGAHGKFPPGQLAPTVDTLTLTDHQLLGHLGYILEHVEQGPLRKAMDRFNWNMQQQGPAWSLDPSGIDNTNITIPVFRCPSDVSDGVEKILVSTIPYFGSNTYELAGVPKNYAGWTNYLGNCGDINSSDRDEGIFLIREQVSAYEIRDGISNTILFGEVTGGTAVVDGVVLDSPWVRHSFMHGGIGCRWGFFQDLPGDNQDTSVHTFSSRHAGGTTYFSFADFSVRPITKEIELEILASLLTRAGKESTVLSF